MKDKLTQEAMAQVIAQRKALEAQGAKIEESPVPAKEAASNEDSSSGAFREITQDKPYDPFALSPGQTPAVRSREKDKGISL